MAGPLRRRFVLILLIAGLRASFGQAEKGSDEAAAKAAAAKARRTPVHLPDMDRSAAVTEEAISALRTRGFNRAYDLASKAIELNPLNVQAWNVRAMADIHAQRYGLAVYDSSFALELMSGNARALSTRSWALGKQGQYSSALRDADAGLTRNPNNGLLHEIRAMALAGLGQRAQALESLRRGAELNPRFEPRYEQALKVPESASLVPLFPDSPDQLGSPPPQEIVRADSLRSAAQNAMSMGDNRLAIENSNLAIAANPRDLRAYNLRAIAHQHLHDYAQELDDVNAGLKVDAENVALLNSKATALNRLNRPQEALETADRVVSIDPNNYYGHYMRAQALAGLGQREAMIQALRKAADLNPGLYKKLQEALHLPSVDDLKLLFPEDKIPEARSDGRRMPLIAATGALGGLLALGIFLLRRRSVREVPSLLRGQYKTLRKIGAGGMGLVYEGKDLSLDRRVAIKKMRAEIRMDPRERERFITEAKVVAALHHPNIVDIYSIVEEGEDVYLVFEYVPGKTIQELLHEKRRFPLNEALPVIKGVAAGLDYAHGRQVIHRDLKPSNIMISEHGEAKVMDFGVARQAKDALTRIMTNTIVGTPPYMAPEQEQGAVHRASDLYSLAVCLYQMLCGELPFLGIGAGMHMNKTHKRYAAITGLVPALPRGIDEIFSKAFEPDPHQRFANAREFSGLLENLALN